jgi:hypothetical protein
MSELKKLFPTDMRKYHPKTNYSKIVLTERISMALTTKMLKGIDMIVASGKFPNRSEFIRHLITNYFDEVIYDE